MPGTYEFAYQPTSPYGHAVTLVGKWRAPQGQVVVDLGCGYGAIAEEVAAAGLSYLGVDADRAAVEALTARGVEALVGDLADPGAVLARVREALGTRRVAALCALDAIEHLDDAAGVLAALCGFARELGAVPLVVSIPNVTHRDLGIKLLLGRWDVTPTGLLDATHLRFFSPAGLAQAMGAAGWAEVEAHDFVMLESDQHFPPDCVALAEQTPLGGLLHTVRGRAAPGAVVNQYVRAYRPAEGVATGAGADAATAEEESAGGVPPFLSVVVRTDGTRPSTFDDLLVALSGQDHEDFEVVVVTTVPGPGVLSRTQSAVAGYDRSFAGRVRILATDRPLSTASAGNLGVAAARGRWVVVLDDDQMPFGHWVGSLAALAAAAPGRVLHCGAATQRTLATPGSWHRAPACGMPGTEDDAGALVDAYDVVGAPGTGESFGVGLLELLAAESPAPICGFAIPRSVFADLGEHFDEDLPALEDWDLLLRAVMWCGAVSTGEIGILRREWVGSVEPAAAGSEPSDVFSRAEAIIAAKLDAVPLVLDGGSASRLSGLVGEITLARREVAAARSDAERSRAESERRLAELHASTSWRATAPLRAATDWWRRRRTAHGS